MSSEYKALSALLLLLLLPACNAGARIGISIPVGPVSIAISGGSRGISIGAGASSGPVHAGITSVSVGAGYSVGPATLSASMSERIAEVQHDSPQASDSWHH